MVVNSAHARLALYVSLVLALLAWAWSVLGIGAAEQSATPNGVQTVEPESSWAVLEERAKREPVTEKMAAQMVRRNFEIMRGQPERMAPSIGRHTRTITGAPKGSFDLSSAQYGHASGTGFWVVGDRNIICLLEGNFGSVACDTAAQFASHGIALGTAGPPSHAGGRPREFRLLGVVPDWVNVVQATIGDRAKDISVADGAYEFQAELPIFISQLCKATNQSCRSA
jgi:hypothetical protein